MIWLEVGVCSGIAPELQKGLIRIAGLCQELSLRLLRYEAGSLSRFIATFSACFLGGGSWDETHAV